MLVKKYFYLLIVSLLYATGGYFLLTENISKKTNYYITILPVKISNSSIGEYNINGQNKTCSIYDDDNIDGISQNFYNINSTYNFYIQIDYSCKTAEQIDELFNRDNLGFRVLLGVFGSIAYFYFTTVIYRRYFTPEIYYTEIGNGIVNFA